MQITAQLGASQSDMISPYSDEQAEHVEAANLPLEDDLLNYNNNGHGFANGLDFILKGRLPFGIDGWLSYGYINTKRKWLDYDEFTSSEFDITHQVSIIAKYFLSAMWQIGINYKHATGRPFTPVRSSSYNSDFDVYEPVYEITNSERYPDYKRLDFRLTHFNQIFGENNTIVYLEALNILNIKNIFGYSYTPDYSERKNISSYFGRRTIVLGMSVTI